MCSVVVYTMLDHGYVVETREASYVDPEQLHQYHLLM